MTADEFRRMALSLPEALESSHMGHPDFRVHDKIFASLAPDESWGMVRLTPDQQEGFIHAEPEVYRPANGAWGARGATLVTLRTARVRSVREALELAWCNTAPAKLVRARRGE